MSPPKRRKQGGDRGRSRRARTPQRDFWGSDATESDEPPMIAPVPDATVMLHSLSSPPLPGRETVAVHYFAAVAERAAGLAIALAAASDLLDTDDDEYDDDDEEDATLEPA